MRLHPLQQVGRLDVGLPVVGIADIGPLAEWRVCLVEQEDCVRSLGGVEDLVER